MFTWGIEHQDEMWHGHGLVSTLQFTISRIYDNLKNDTVSRFSCFNQQRIAGTTF